MVTKSYLIIGTCCGKQEAEGEQDVNRCQQHHGNTSPPHWNLGQKMTQS
jgi:hypothetical protein